MAATIQAKQDLVRHLRVHSNMIESLEEEGVSERAPALLLNLALTMNCELRLVSEVWNRR